MRALVVMIVFAASAAVEARAARCTITSPEQPTYRGPCDFIADRNGSFGILPIGRDTFFPQIIGISFEITKPGVGDVRGLTSFGINSRWGTAIRSRRNPACWTGADFTICVYR
ncbi:MAG TPA: hypothetical protein VGD10_09480 [Allosphingosinicella sp.]|uniref:hypothetical protein n=1 Tax=Allosphingosinicella sp. TaxID=2823234 RepID=UPI002ED7AB2E